MALPEIEWSGVANGGLRDRVDLILDRRTGSSRLGLFDRFRNGIVDLQGCPQLSSSLEAWLRDFRRIEIPVERGSVRLRVSPSGARGVWLDFANVDIKRLLEERTSLDQLRDQAIVEIGQKRKRLVERDGALKLSDPVLEPWFETRLSSGPVPLYCAIGSFTQPGFEANRALVKAVRSLLETCDGKIAAEFGSGIGNFTIPLAEAFESVHAYEVDALALQGLRRTLSELGWEARVAVHSGNFQVDRREAVSFSGVDVVLVDPPRSGLMKFLDPLASLAFAERPRHFVYVSCFTESFVIDARRLYQLGYELSRVGIVDQFPQSRHYEIAASFERRGS